MAQQADADFVLLAHGHLGSGGAPSQHVALCFEKPERHRHNCVVHGLCGGRAGCGDVACARVSVFD